MTEESDAYRQVLSRFASGVTVVTCWRDQQPDGVTVSAFSAVSLHPQLVLVCVGVDSDCHALLTATERFGINILTRDQAELALAFAGTGSDKHRALKKLGDPWVRDEVPLLRTCVARLTCRLQAAHEAGDHHVLIGEVQRLEIVGGNEAPLIYHRGDFCELA